MIEATFKITGDKELDRKLAGLEPKLRKKVMRQATREAAKYVAADARRMVPVDEGDLEKSIKVRARKRTNRKDQRGLVGHGIFSGSKHIDGGLPFYASFIELGWKYFAGDPFLRPALWGNEKRVRAMFARRIREGLAKLARMP